MGNILIRQDHSFKNGSQLNKLKRMPILIGMQKPPKDAKISK